jgi:hypothetical protein
LGGWFQQGAELLEDFPQRHVVNQQRFVYLREASEYGGIGGIGGDILAHFDEGAEGIVARKSAYNLHLDADASVRNSSTDQKEEQRFLAWQKAVVGRR